MNTYKPLVRLYYYTDSDRGLGDGGTFKYVRMTEDCFIGTKNIAFNGNEYIRWNYSDKGVEFVNTVNGWNYYDIGWQFVDEDVYDTEIAMLKSKLSRMTEIKTNN